ncbi:flavodoxin domain-containing protein [Streptomyces sp. AM8-1-1]|uniref:flavodoxin domain-containing protein n=1 Tax=Streptomyces sp. AM8-1-1 TaxID=3075825 RepID=UPI0028C50FB4|nr:flavodoxin domain-containing protein [Streptomyces sp. AM8-1-1]WNO70276.1 flavodoxin domain-containing protein [Streptomyces sp. AM8-1-1]
MTTNVLVAYAGKNGSTEEIAHWIADTLNDSGVAAVARPAAREDAPGQYDAVVLGGSLYAGRWHHDARRFARRHAKTLATRPLWLFSSGPLDASAADRNLPPVKGVARLAVRLDARGHTTFGGRLEEGAKGRIARMIIQQGRGGDFRDKQQIRDWAQNIAAELTAAERAA